MQKKALIVDLDGTLYYQKPVQICMALELLIYYLLHFWRIKELKTLLLYRSKHNQDASIDLNSFCKQQKSDFNMTNLLIQKWLFSKPLKWIKLFADKELINFLKKIKQQIPVVVYSDYETYQKLKALNFKPDFEFFYDMVNIRFLKPNPQGLSFIAKKLNLSEKEIFIIGDRQDKDGLVATNFGSEYLILPQNPVSRKKIRKSLENNFYNFGEFCVTRN